MRDIILWMVEVMPVLFLHPESYPLQVICRKSVIVANLREYFRLLFEHIKLAVKHEGLLGGFTDIKNEDGWLFQCVKNNELPISRTIP